jgi:tRNA 2-selenouridine synthase
VTERSNHPQRVSVDALADHPDRIDVRSPGEFAQDHLPNASSHPVLADEERGRVGTLYTTSPFAARKLGAAMVARNIATMIEGAFAHKPREWMPLVYCWRGGQRSRSLVHVLNEIGWRAKQLDGGYRAYRRHVVAQLALAPARLRFMVISGLTGCGKSRLLSALADAGAQTLDLERLAVHRGSLLGGLPDENQPSQKGFESALLEALLRFDATRPVFVESESRRIGALQVPDALLIRMRDASTFTLEMPVALRVRLLLEDYRHFLTDASLLRERLSPLVSLHGKATLMHWDALAAAGEWETLVGELLDVHYDPSYRRSLRHSFARRQEEQAVQARDITPAAFAALADELMAETARDLGANRVSPCV